LSPHSLIREDDIEVYIRSVAHRNKINKLVNKYMSRLKWLVKREKYQIFENSIADFFAAKNSNIEKQKSFVGKIRENAIKTRVMTPQLEHEL